MDCEDLQNCPRADGLECLQPPIKLTFLTDKEPRGAPVNCFVLFAAAWPSKQAYFNMEVLYEEVPSPGALAETQGVEQSAPPELPYVLCHALHAGAMTVRRR